MKVPKYRKHSLRNIGMVAWKGKRYYLPGEFNSKESKNAYVDFIDQNCRETSASVELPVKVQSADYLVELADRYLRYATDYYGEGRTELAVYRRILMLMVEHYGHLRTSDFGPMKLTALRDCLATTDQTREYKNKAGKVVGERKYRLSRKTINHMIGDLKRVFKWGVSQEIVKPDQWMALNSVPGLRVGRTKAIELGPRMPVAWEDVEKVLPKVSKVVAAMIQLQWHTGCRPQQVCLLKPNEIDRSTTPWTWTPSHHKGKWRGQRLTLFIGPKAREVLSPFLDRDADQFCFQPAESNGKTGRDHYGPDTYQRAILYGIAKLASPKIEPPFSRAKFERAKLTYWTPHQLRHAKAQKIRDELGIEAAQAILGHSSIDATQIYAKKSIDRGREIAENQG